ncbi:DUF4105 domain-containing protein [Sulfitobacter sp. F26204]|uniref:Lnb N-terminal periplasmic domain-containing protein n=1 Tax=Sulfitobacter sp. F26204 TaxID=2996014 RepID=UPI00225E15F9|nr:DUF4105 domain-containing protein [Sulfitobacter sp. F26204]MCX7559245.1 DUF4105 domain-containing protein [Sulfitobacter sp. F26204]
MTRRTITVASVGRFVGHLLFALVAIAGVAWVWGAMSVHLSGNTFQIGFAAVVLAAVFAFGIRFYKRRLGWLSLVAIAGVIGVWYQGITPAQDREWAFDVAHGVGAKVEGDLVTLSNIRNFNWRDAAQADQSWETRTVDLNKLQSVDMLTSVWDNPEIAHLLVSFGFVDGQRVVFSVEIRKESHESFNVKGGFFRQFELVLVAATEDDIIKLRTNHRQEDVRLYPVNLNAQQRRDLFMSYVDLAQDLEKNPMFYNTITANCTTTVYGLARVIKPDMTPDWRLVLSGHLPDYVDGLGGFDGSMPIEERVEMAQITPKALSYSGADYSSAIRQGITSK